MGVTGSTSFHLEFSFRKMFWKFCILALLATAVEEVKGGARTRRRIRKLELKYKDIQGGGGGGESGLEDRVAANEQKVATNEQVLASLGSEVGNLGSEMDNLGSEMDTLGSEVGNLGSELDDVKDTVAINEQDIDDLAATVSSIESDVVNNGIQLYGALNLAGNNAQAIDDLTATVSSIEYKTMKMSVCGISTESVGEVGTIKYNTIETLENDFNIGGLTTAGIFTAPATGTYEVSADALCINREYSDQWADLVKNGDGALDYSFLYGSNLDDYTDIGASCSGFRIVNLEQEETLQLEYMYDAAGSEISRVKFCINKV